MTSLPEHFAHKSQGQARPGAIKVTRHNKPVLAILPWDLYESIMETLEILADEEQMVALRQGAQEAVEGQGKPWKIVKKELGWDKTEFSFCG